MDLFNFLLCYWPPCGRPQFAKSSRASLLQYAGVLKRVPVKHFLRIILGFVVWGCLLNTATAWSAQYKIPLPGSTQQTTNTVDDTAAIDQLSDSDPKKAWLKILFACKRGDHKAEVEAAQFAETNHHPRARSYWTQLSIEEIVNGMLAQGLEHAHHVMDLYSTKHVGFHTGVLGDPDNILNVLIYKGYKSEAERLAVEAVARTKEVAGDSVATQAQLADLFAVYLRLDKKEDAMKTLTEILRLDVTSGETLSQSLGRTHCYPPLPQAPNAVMVIDKVSWSMEQIKPRDLNFENAAYEKILKAQKSQLAANPLLTQTKEELLLPTLSKLGDIQFELKKYTEADKYFNEAFELSTKYHHGQFALSLAGKNYLANLRELGKGAEADQLASLKWDGNGPPEQK
jgi:tetratricopeptide (TPR) repeat protein